MSNRTVKYTAGEIGSVRVVKDFLPAPNDLVPRENNVKVTLSLSRRSLDFFKREAKKRRGPYQRMIRALVDAYAERQAGGTRRTYGGLSQRVRPEVADPMTGSAKPTMPIRWVSRWLNPSYALMLFAPSGGQSAGGGRCCWNAGKG
jgi:hypothetical protein